MKTGVVCASLFASVSLVGCAYMAVSTAPPKQASTKRTEAAVKADAQFWEVFHGGKYDDIATVLNAETAAYLEDPGDAVTAAHVGWLHIWRLSERARHEVIPATITDDATVSRKYFQEAVTLDPNDSRYLGFLAAATLAEGTIHRDEKETRQGYFQMLDAIDAWPEFNLFTAGYTLSQQPYDSERYAQAVEWQWRTLDVCAGEPVSRSNPDYARFMKLAATTGRKRVCWNSAIAPHNFEGFFLNMGDMLVKAGDWKTAQKIYADAKLSPTDAQWKYRGVLEQRIANAEANVAAFRTSDPKRDGASSRMMFVSTLSCMGCHQD